MVDLILTYSLLGLSLFGIIYFLKGFSYKDICILIFGGAMFAVVLQTVYISFQQGLDFNLFFVSGTIEFQNYINNTHIALSQHTGSILGWSLFLSLIIPATVEELGKFFIFRFLGRQLGLIHGVASSIFVMIYVALGFAFFETALYFFFLTQDNYAGVGMITIERICTSVLSHILFSAILAHAYGKSRFIEFEMIDNLRIGRTIKIIKTLKHIPYIRIHSLTGYYAFRYMFIGICGSVLLHSIYNYCMKSGYEALGILTILIGGTIFIATIFVHTPNESYQNIRNKIQYLKEIKELKAKIQDNRHIQ